MHKTTVNIQPYFIILGVFTALIIPLKFIIAWLIAAAVHEIGHLISLILLGKQVYCIDIGCFGASIQTDTLTYKEECIAGFSGPFAGALLLFFIRIMPLVATCALIQTLYNLLPFYPMDGGRVMLSALQLVFGHKRGKIISRNLILILFALMMLCMFMAVNYISIGFWVLLIVFIVIKTKTTCKR